MDDEYEIDWFKIHEEDYLLNPEAYRVLFIGYEADGTPWAAVVYAGDYE